ncbi:MAG: ribosomal-processing cysteine protease Prp [Clostridiales bacterium]|nr:ribosomal-processing cysteine protease Prp [Clostridiales bacterium]
MITVKIVRTGERKISGIFVSGHSGYAESGSDIVCAGASTLIYTLINSLERICGSDPVKISNIIEGEDVNAEVIVPSEDRAQIIAETIATGYMSLAASVNGDGMQYIMIKEEI